MKAVIPAAGLGTRFLPITKSVPKELLPILNKPTIQYVVEEALKCASEAIIVLSDDKPALKQHFSPAPDLVTEIEQRGKPELAALVEQTGSLAVSFANQPQALGLGHAVWCAREAVLGSDPSLGAATDNFFVLLGDVIVPDANILPAMLKISKSHYNASVIAVLAVPRHDVSRFGIVGGTPTAEQGVLKIDQLVEKPALADAPSNLSIFGRYLLSPRIFDILEHTAKGAGGEIQLTDAMIKLLATEVIYSYEVSAQDGLDAGTIESWLAANIAMAQREKLAV